MFEFTLPSLGADMDSGTMLEWKIKPGDRVERGQVVAVVDTSKAAIDVECWTPGTVQELLIEPGMKVPVGTPIALLREAGESAAAPAAEAAAKPDRQAEMRRTIANAMSRSKREIPHYYLQEAIPLWRALAWLEKHNADRPVTERILPALLLLKAVALATRKVPEMNGYWRDGAFQPMAACHPGVAISLRQGGLVAPALHDVADKPLPQLMRELTELVARTRAGTLRSSELADPTLTVSNLGERGTQLGFGVIYPPQVALVGFGRISEQPWVEGGQLRACPLVQASLAADHRVSDGQRGALFLIHIGELLQQPELL